MGRVPWEWFITLTFDPKRAMPASAQRAGREAFWWLGEIGRLLRRPVAWLYATERGRSGQWHIHALLAGRISRRDLNAPKAMWWARNGHADVRSLSGTDRVTLYATKEAAFSGEIVVSDTLMRYRSALRSDLPVLLYPDASLR